MLAAAGAGESIAMQAGTIAVGSGNIFYKILRFLYKNAHYDLIDSNAFPLNETGVRLWTLVVFGCLSQNALIKSDSNMSKPGLSASMFAQLVVFQGIIVHCTYKILSHWSGARWNWGLLWVYIVFFVTQSVYTYVENNSVVGNFDITSVNTTMSSKQKAVFYSTVGVVCAWLIANIVTLAKNKKIYAPLYSPVASIKRLAWLVLVIVVLGLHTRNSINGEIQVLHYHHALVAWAIFCVTVLFGTVHGWINKINHFFAVISLAVMTHGSVVYGIKDYEFFTQSSGTGPAKSDRNIYVSVFICAVIILSIPLERKKKTTKKPRVQEEEKGELLRAELRL
jgi:hypothetical protein